MGLQIWTIEAIENILWAIQTVIQATTATPEGQDYPAEYQRGFKRGFETALHHMTTAFEAKPESPEIWDQEHIESVLLVTQSVIQTVPAVSKEQVKSADDNQGFRRGLEAALWCVATSFGISLVSLTSDSTPAEKVPSPASSFWFREDIDNILSAFQLVLQGTVIVAESPAQLADYNRGFEDALYCVAKSLGIRLLWSQDRPAPAKTALWLRQNIRYHLQTVYRTRQATTATLENSNWSDDYNLGFETALRCLAGAFGVSLSVNLRQFQDLNYSNKFDSPEVPPGDLQL